MSIPLKFKIKGKEVEASVTLEQFLRILNESDGEQILSISAKTETIPHKPRKRGKQSIEEQPDRIDVPLPSNQDVKAYVMSLPKFKHTLFDVQEHFFGKRFVSRGNTNRMYHKTFHQLQDIRKQIAYEEGGNFEMIVGPKRVNTYVFKKTQTLMESIPQ